MTIPSHLCSEFCTSTRKQLNFYPPTQFSIRNRCISRHCRPGSNCDHPTNCEFGNFGISPWGYACCIVWMCRYKF